MIPPHSLIHRIAAEQQRELLATYATPPLRDDGSSAPLARVSESLPAHVLRLARRSVRGFGVRPVVTRGPRGATRS